MEKSGLAILVNSLSTSEPLKNIVLSNKVLYQLLVCKIGDLLGFWEWFQISLKVSLGDFLWHLGLVWNLQMFAIPQTINWWRTFLEAQYSWMALKVRRFQKEFMKSLFLPKYEQKTVRISALCSEGRNLDKFCSYFGRNDNFINSFWNCLTFIHDANGTRDTSGEQIYICNPNICSILLL